MKKLMVVLLTGMMALNCGFAADLLSKYSGTYVPESYLTGLEKYNSHVKASLNFRRAELLSPNVVVVNSKGVELNFNFHEGYRQDLVESGSDSITVKSYDGNHVYKVEDNQFIYIDDVKYKKIDNSSEMKDCVISRFLTKHLLSGEKLRDGKKTLYVCNGKICYDGEKYTYGTALVFESHKYDKIVNTVTKEAKYIEITDDGINVYTAYSPDGNYDLGWESNAEYTLEASLK